MNKEKIKNRVIEFLKQPLIYVVLICIIFQIKLYNSTEKTHISYDSLTYLEFSNSEGILKGQVDEKRTPIYPYFIKIIKKVGGTENLEENITLVQKYLFILTLLLFYACVKSITKNKLIISIATLIFGISPFIIMWNIPILTESISIFEMTVLALLTIQYLKKPRYILSGSIGFVILIMIMTRPAFIYILPIYFLFWILKLFFNKEEKKQVILGIVSCIVCGLMLLIYCFLMLQQHGKFALTTVSALNNAVSVIQSKTYKKTENKEMIKVIDDALDEDKTIWEAYDVLANKFDEKEINELVKVATKTPEYKQYLLKKTLELGYNNIGLSYVNNIDISNKDKPYIISYKYIGSTIFPVTFGLLYCVILYSILYLIYNLFKTKKVNWIVAFFTSLIFANIATLIIGAPEEEQRLFSASMPLVMLYVVYIANLTLKNGGRK